MGLGIYNPDAVSASGTFTELSGPCAELTAGMAQECQEVINQLELGPNKVLCIVLKSRPDYDIRSRNVAGTYVITKAEKWIEASMLMVRIQDFASLGEYRATRGVRTKYDVLAAETDGFTDLVVERVTKDYRKFDDLEFPTSVVERVKGIGPTPLAATTKVSNVKVNPPLPSRAEMAGAFMRSE